MVKISTPIVRLVTRPSVDWDEVAAFLDDEEVPGVPESIRAGTDVSAAIAEISARLCYMSYGKGRTDIEEFITNLLRHKDGSVLEHINYGFSITGVSRSLTHELVRHRAGFAYSQRSQRYVDESSSQFVIPPVLKQPGMEKALEAFTDAMEQSADAYNKMVEVIDESLPRDGFVRATERRKAVRQAARSVLPNATETKIFVTGNVRAWRHFLEMRASEYADVEIRRLAMMVLKILQVEAPLLFNDFKITQMDDGTEIATPEHSKV